MDYEEAFYSLVQYCPDPSRSEAANVGIVMLVPHRKLVLTKMARGNQRPRKFFGRQSFDSTWLRSAKESLAERVCDTEVGLKSLSDFQQFVCTRANELILTEPKPMRVRDPDSDLEDLFEELVEADRSENKQRSLIPELEKAFRSPGLAERVKFGYVAHIPVLGRELRADYAYQNGKLNLVKAQRLAPSLDNISRCSLLATEARFLRQAEDPAKLIVVPDAGAFPNERAMQDVRRSVDAIFQESGVRTIWNEDRDAFIREVDHQAHL